MKHVGLIQKISFYILSEILKFVFYKALGYLVNLIKNLLDFFVRGEWVSFSANIIFYLPPPHPIIKSFLIYYDNNILIFYFCNRLNQYCQYLHSYSLFNIPTAADLSVTDKWDNNEIILIFNFLSSNM